MKKRVALLSLSLIFLSGCNNDYEFKKPKNEVNQKEVEEVKGDLFDFYHDIFWGDKDFYFQLRTEINVSDKITNESNNIKELIVQLDREKSMVYIKDTSSGVKESIFVVNEKEYLLFNCDNKTYSKNKIYTNNDAKYFLEDAATHSLYNIAIYGDYYEHLYKNYPNINKYYLDNNMYTHISKVDHETDEYYRFFDGMAQCVYDDLGFVSYVKTKSILKKYEFNNLVVDRTEDEIKSMKFKYENQIIKDVNINEYTLVD